MLSCFKNSNPRNSKRSINKVGHFFYAMVKNNSSSFCLSFFFLLSFFLSFPIFVDFLSFFGMFQILFILLCCCSNQIPESGPSKALRPALRSLRLALIPFQLTYRSLRPPLDHSSQPSARPASIAIIVRGARWVERVFYRQTIR